MGEHFSDQVGDERLDIGLAVANLVYGVDRIGLGILFQQIAVDPGEKGANQVFRGFVHG